MSGEVEALVPFVIRGLPRERQRVKRGCKLVGDDGREIRIAGIPEHTKVVVRRGAKEGKEGGGVTIHLGREVVEQIGGSGD